MTSHKEETVIATKPKKPWKTPTITVYGPVEQLVSQSKDAAGPPDGYTYQGQETMTS